uniref:Uncharacterized protein n=1 Tax=Daphnia galeata TaxID=27404 RepID=A0A8J2RCD6_9CRUS|nr:unnamed protein product [Daphnia galeata]
MYSYIFKSSNYGLLYASNELRLREEQPVLAEPKDVEKDDDDNEGTGMNGSDLPFDPLLRYNNFVGCDSLGRLEIDCLSLVNILGGYNATHHATSLNNELELTEGSEKRNDGVEICPEPIALRYRHGNLTTRWGTSGPTCIRISAFMDTLSQHQQQPNEIEIRRKKRDTRQQDQQREYGRMNHLTYCPLYRHNMTNTQSAVQKGCDPGRAPLSTDLANAT